MNMQFLRKLASDELTDTLFFATGTRPIKTKTTEKWSLQAGQFEIDIVNNRNIKVNGDRCKSVPEAKFVIQEMIQNAEFVL